MTKNWALKANDWLTFFVVFLPAHLPHKKLWHQHFGLVQVRKKRWSTGYLLSPRLQWDWEHDMKGHRSLNSFMETGLKFFFFFFRKVSLEPWKRLILLLLVSVLIHMCVCVCHGADVFFLAYIIKCEDYLIYRERVQEIFPACIFFFFFWSRDPLTHCINTL